jgi:hypothetical protein
MKGGDNEPVSIGRAPQLRAENNKRSDGHPRAANADVSPPSRLAPDSSIRFDGRYDLSTSLAEGYAPTCIRQRSAPRAR